MMNCTINGCPGTYENKYIVHTVKSRGEVIVIDKVPAEVCDICGDVLLDSKTVKHIDKLLFEHKKPKRTAPVYEYA
jgi:YgiT-type zinc finger domain-containing protein